MKALILFTMALSIHQSASAQGSAKHFQHSLETAAPAAEIWRIWTDVDQWPTWDIGLQQAVLAGPFVEGTKGTLISDQGQKARFVITAVDEGTSYTFKTKLPLGSLEITRSLVAETDTVRFTHAVKFRGLTGGLFARKLGKGYQKMLPKAMQKVKQQAENR
jgi:hypothetical protein